MTWPAQFTDEHHLEEVMSRPSEALVRELGALQGNIMVLGAAGKMGPTLARMAKRAAPNKRVMAVARFSEPGLFESMQSQGIECLRADLLDPVALRDLPDADHVVFMAGRKFGSQGSEWLTWAMNAHVPALVAQRYAQANFCVFSTACVYPFVSVEGAGATESSPLTPVGEYANSCVARERLFQHFSHALGIRGTLLRLSYAIDMRYGVLHDLAQALIEQRPIALAMGHANLIWQGDANEIALRSLCRTQQPMVPLNLSGPMVSIRSAAVALAERLGTTARFEGQESSTAWLVDCSRMNDWFGPPRVTLDQMLDATAAWVSQGQASLGKPTHFEVRHGHY
ncbi:MAG: hypothetical protein RIT26_2315 [Pseudomonadota bacterium]|jgi:nucleoside-diphosphate-sugar epimerase